MSEKITNILQYRQEREQFINEALGCPDYLDELRKIEGAIQEQMNEMDWIMLPVEITIRPTFRCIKGGMFKI